MEGYLKNLSTSWRHIFKRSVRPGGKIPLKELYDVYGTKHNIKEGKDFVSWLNEVKLKNMSEFWEVSSLSDTIPEDLTKKEDAKEVAAEDKPIKSLTVEDIVLLPVRKAREAIPAIMDSKLLKYALQEARPRANKESLCRILEKRINELQVTRQV